MRIPERFDLGPVPMVGRSPAEHDVPVSTFSLNGSRTQGTRGTRARHRQLTGLRSQYESLTN